MILLPSGNGVTGNPVTVLLPSLGDSPVNSTSPLGPVTVTMIVTTLVAVGETDTC